MAHYLLKYTGKGKRAADAPFLVRIEATGLEAAQEKAEDAADSRGGEKAVLQLFNEIGLVCTRTAEGRWNI